MIPRDIFTFLAKQKLGVLGTISADSTPQSALMGIAVTPQLEIVFDTVKSSRKYPNLVAQPACSFLIGGWNPNEGEKTVQYEGEAHELHPPNLEHYLEIYFKTWPDGPARLNWPGIAYFVVQPKWVRYCDYGQNPPLKLEFTFP
jgi:general stress protein 26